MMNLMKGQKDDIKIDDLIVLQEKLEAKRIANEKKAEEMEAKMADKKTSPYEIDMMDLINGKSDLNIGDLITKQERAETKRAKK